MTINTKTHSIKITGLKKKYFRHTGKKIKPHIKGKKSDYESSGLITVMPYARGKKLKKIKYLLRMLHPAK